MKPEGYGVIDKVMRGLMEILGVSIRAREGPKEIFRN